MSEPDSDQAGATYRDRIVRFVEIPASQIKPHPKNWRTHPESQRKAVDAALTRIGNIDVIKVFINDRDEYVAIDGHLRDSLYGDELIRAAVTDLTEEEAEEAVLTFDPLATLAGQDDDMLSELLDSITFDEKYLQEVHQDLKKQLPLVVPDIDEIAADVDAGEELQKKWNTQAGQLWIIKGPSGLEHRVICGDATDKATIKRLFGDARPFIMVTDPPYGVEYDPEWRLRTGLNKEHQTRAEGTVSNDDNASWKAAWDLFPGNVCYVWHGALHSTIVGADLIASRFDLRAQVIWRKTSLVIGRGAYHWQHEPCWYGARGVAKWSGDRKQSTVWDIPNMHRTQGNVDDGHTIHSTQKPIECMARPIRHHGGKEDDVYDPFMGSGTTLLAAEQLGRRCFGCELDPIYIAVELDRMTKAGCECSLASQ